MQAVLNQSGRQQPKLWESGKNAIAFFPRRVQPAVFPISFDSWGGSLSSSNPGSIPDSAEALDNAQLEKVFTNGRKGKRQQKNGAYVTCPWLAENTGYHEDTIRKQFLREKSGVGKRTFSGRNRKVY